MMNLFDSRPKPASEHLARIKEWVRAHFQLGEDATILVTELRCSEVGCPPVETVIAIWRQGPQPQQYKVFKAVAEVTASDVQSATLQEHPAS